MYDQAVANLMPGMGPTKTASYRKIWKSKTGVQYLPGGGVIDGTKSRDPLNVGDLDTLRAGLLMGKITASGKYAPSVLGVLAAGYGGVANTLNIPAAAAVELVRRVGATGTFKLTGPATTAGTVRTQTVTYSAVNQGSGAVTITALQAGAVNAVNQVEALVVVDDTGSGTFTLTCEGLTTGAITYSSTPATLVSRINSALDAVFGTGAIVASGASLAAIILTFSGTGYSGRPIIGHVTSALTQTGSTFTINGSATAGTTTTTTLGVSAVAATNGAFVAGSLIQPTDGSETIRTFIDAEDGIKVTFEGTGYDIEFPRPPLSGIVDADQIVNYPSDAAVKAYIKAALKTSGPFVFSDDL